MLLNAICTELGATLFDLTATNIVGKYPGKSGLNMLLHLVSKVGKDLAELGFKNTIMLQVGRLLQPSVVFIDQAEKTFIKKVSKTDKSDPKRLRKDLPKLVKNIAPEDQVSVNAQLQKIDSKNICSSPSDDSDWQLQSTLGV